MEIKRVPQINNMDSLKNERNPNENKGQEKWRENIDNKNKENNKKSNLPTEPGKGNFVDVKI